MDRDRNRRERDRDHGRDNRRRRTENVDEDSDSPQPQPKPKRTGLQEYWIDGAGINREVLQRQICFMLGNEARSKPDKFNGVPGFRISAIRPFTEKQLEDLIEISEEFEKERKETQRRHKTGYPDFSYDQSKTKERYNHPSHPDPEPGPYRGDEGYGYQGRPGAHEGYQAGMPQYGGQYGPQSGHNQAFPNMGRRPSPPLTGPANYPVTGYQEGRPPRGFQDHHMQRPDAGPPYQYGNEMDIDDGPAAGYRTGGFSRPGQPPGYGLAGGPPPPANYGMGALGFGAPPGAAYMPPPDMRDVPRNIPPMDPPGRQTMRMPQDYEYDASMQGYNRGPAEKDKRPRYDDYRKR